MRKRTEDALTARFASYEGERINAPMHAARPRSKSTHRSMSAIDGAVSHGRFATSRPRRRRGISIRVGHDRPSRSTRRRRPRRRHPGCETARNDSPRAPQHERSHRRPHEPRRQRLERDGARDRSRPNPRPVRRSSGSLYGRGRRVGDQMAAREPKRLPNVPTKVSPTSYGRIGTKRSKLTPGYGAVDPLFGSLAEGSKR